MCHLVIGKSQEVWQSRTCLEIPCYLPRSWGAKCLTTANYIIFSLLTPFSLKVSSKNGQITPNTVTHPYSQWLTMHGQNSDMINHWLSLPNDWIIQDVVHHHIKLWSAISSNQYCHEAIWLGSAGTWMRVPYYSPPANTDWRLHTYSRKLNTVHAVSSQAIYKFKDTCYIWQGPPNF